MICDLPSNCRGLVVAVTVVIAAGIASTRSAEARLSTAPAISLDEAAPSQSAADGAIVVADKNWDGGNDNGDKNGKGKKSGNNNHNGNWNKNSDNKNWSGNGKNWKGNDKNWSGNNKNWNGNGKNWKNGGKNWSKNNHWNRDWDNRAYVRGWSRRPYYGEFFGGVVLGSILAAAGVGVVPYSPDPNLCWYWADPYMYRGYWDYCY
jgi:hypothetical protein